MVLLQKDERQKHRNSIFMFFTTQPKLYQTDWWMIHYSKGGEKTRQWITLEGTVESRQVPRLTWASGLVKVKVGWWNWLSGKLLGGVVAVKVLMKAQTSSWCICCNHSVKLQLELLKSSGDNLLEFPKADFWLQNVRASNQPINLINFTGRGG